MNIEDLQITRASILMRCVQHVAYYKVLHEESRKKNAMSPFWTATIDAHILQAILQWNMIFGNDGYNSHYHWKKNLSETKIKSFQDKLESSLTKERWDTIWKAMTEFRNKYVAHRDSNYGVVPILSEALEVVYLYDDWIYDNNLIEIHTTNLKNLYSKLCQEIAPMLPLLLDINEEKYGNKLIEYDIEE